MQLSSLLLAFAASSVLASNTLDVAEEGVFLVRTNDQGVEEIETLLSARDLDEMELGHTTRADQNVFCGCGFGLNPRHTDRVIKDLRHQLARDAKPGAGGLLYTEIKPGQSYYSEMGLDTVAFVCNYLSDGNVRIQVSQYRDIIASITRACGGYIAGSAGIRGAVSVGYMRSNQNFCRYALASNADHC